MLNDVYIKYQGMFLSLTLQLRQKDSRIYFFLTPVHFLFCLPLCHTSPPHNILGTTFQLVTGFCSLHTAFRNCDPQFIFIPIQALTSGSKLLLSLFLSIPPPSFCHFMLFFRFLLYICPQIKCIHILVTHTLIACSQFWGLGVVGFCFPIINNVSILLPSSREDQ